MISLTRFCMVLLAFGCSVAYAQDVMQQQQIINQTNQAVQQSIQASQQAQQQVQQASQQAQQAMQNSQDQYNGPARAAKPVFSLKPGKYVSTITLRIKDTAPFANIYYTTDGWTPTEHSTLYTGPIVLTTTSLVQAVAIAPDHMWSSTASGMYVIDGAPFDPCSSEAVSDFIASDSGVPVPLMFTATVDSRNAKIGDTVPLAVTRDVEVGGSLIARKGAPAAAVITQVNSAGLAMRPGAITFQMKSLDESGKMIPLRGVDSKVAPAVNPTPYYALGFAVPFAGPLIFLHHGNNAIVQTGTCVTAFLQTNTANEK